MVNLVVTEVKIYCHVRVPHTVVKVEVPKHCPKKTHDTKPPYHSLHSGRHPTNVMGTADIIGDQCIIDDLNDLAQTLVAARSLQGSHKPICHAAEE